MNRIYKVVWNKVRNCYVVVSELAKSTGKSSQDKRVRPMSMKAAAVLAAFFVTVGGGALTAVQAAGTTSTGINTSVNTDGTVEVDATKYGGPKVTVTDIQKKSVLEHAGIVPGKADLGNIAIAGNASARGKGLFGAVAIGNGATISWDKTETNDKGEVVPKNGWGMLAMGDGAQVKNSFFGVQLGAKGAINNSDYSVSVGGAGTIDNSRLSTALGNGTMIKNSRQGVALGVQAQIFNSFNSVALGAGSVVARDNTVSIGRSKSDIEAYNKYVDEWNASHPDPNAQLKKWDVNTYVLNRQLTGLANGTEANDAVTVGQVENGYVAYDENEDASVNPGSVTFKGTTQKINDKDVNIGTKLNNVNDISFNVPVYETEADKYAPKADPSIGSYGLITETGTLAGYESRSLTSAGLLPGKVSGDNGKGYNVALGRTTSIDGAHAGAIAVGKDATVIFDDKFNKEPNKGTESPNDAISIGTRTKNYNSFSGVALGASSGTWQSNWGTALGTDSHVDNSYYGTAAGVFAKVENSAEGLALGRSAYVKGAPGSVALGSKSVADEENVISVGHKADDLRRDGKAYGDDLKRRITNVADGAIVNGSTDAVTGGQLAASGIIGGKTSGTVDDHGNQSSLSIALGQGSDAGTDYKSYKNTVVGTNASTKGATFATAIGNEASVYGGATRAVALGAGSAVQEGDMIWNVDGDKGVVSVGKSGKDGFTRRIINVKDGQADSDAVTVRQLNGVSADVTDLDTKVGTGDFRKTNYAQAPTVTGAIYGLDSQVKTNTDALDAFLDTGIIAGTTKNDRNPGFYQTALGNGSVVNAEKGTALGSYAKVEQGASESVALGTGSVAGWNDVNVDGKLDPRGVVSVGKSGADGFTRRIVNVKAGVNETDAVNYGQLKEVVANAGFTVDFAQPDGTVQTKDIKPGNTVTVTGNNDNILAKVDDKGQVNISLNDSIKLGDQKNPGVALDGNEGTLAVKNANGGLNVTKDLINATADDAYLTVGKNGAGLGYGDNNIHVTDQGTYVSGKFNATAGGNVGGVKFTGVDEDGLGKVTNIAAGTNTTDAVNYGQLKEVSDVANAGFTVAFAQPDGTVQTKDIKPGNTVTVTGNNDNILAKVDDKGQVNISLNDNLNINSLTAANDISLTNNGVSRSFKDAGLLPGHAFGNEATVIGEKSTANAHGVALGYEAHTYKDWGTALGEWAQANAEGAVALGSGSIANEAHTVSVGSGKAGAPDATRRIVNVAAGVGGTDAVNVDQLKSSVGEATEGVVYWDDKQANTTINGVGLKGNGDLTATTATIAGLGFTNGANPYLGSNFYGPTLAANGSSLTFGGTGVALVGPAGTNGYSNTLQIKPDDTTLTGNVTIVPQTNGNGTGNLELTTGKLLINKAGNEGGGLDATYFGVTGDFQSGYNRTTSNVSADENGVNLSYKFANSKDSTQDVTNTIAVNQNGVQLNGLQVSSKDTDGLSKISNVAAGTADTDAVNYKQLNDTIGTATKDAVRWDAGTTDTIHGVKLNEGNVYAASAQLGNVVLQNGKVYAPNGADLGAVTVSYNGKISGVADGTESTDAVNYKQLQDVKAEAGKHSVVKAGDKNVVVKDTETDGQHTYEVSLGKDITLDGKLQAAGATLGDLTVNGATALRNGKTAFLVDANGITATVDKTSVLMSGNGVQVTGNTQITGNTNVTGNLTVNTVLVATQNDIKDVNQNIQNISGKLDNVSNKVDSLDNTVTSQGESIKDLQKDTAQNKQDIADNKAQIDKNSQAISDNKAQINQNKNDIAANKAQIDKNTADIAQNKQDIAANKAQIDKNTAAIDKNSADIAKNTEQINKNTDAIQSNTERIDGLEKSNSATNAQVKKNTEAINQNKADIQANKDAIALEVKNRENAVKDEAAKREAEDKALSGRIDANKTVLDKHTELIGATGKDGALQLKNGESTIEKGINANTDAIEKNSERIGLLGGAVSKLDDRVNRVGAGAAALAALHPLDYDPANKWDFAAGYGNYKGASAVSVGTYYRPNENTMFSVGGSFGGGENMVNAGVSFKFGDGKSTTTTSRAAMAKTIDELQANNKSLQDTVTAQGKQLKDQDAKMKELEEKLQKLLDAQGVDKK